MPAALTVLDISSNQLKMLENVRHLVHVEEFWASANQFDSFADVEKELQPLTKIETVYLEGNPLAKDIQYRLKIKLLLPQVKQIDAEFVRDVQAQ